MAPHAKPLHGKVMDRRDFLKLAAVSAVASSVHARENEYVRGNTDWLANCRYGMGIHWPPKTTARTGPPSLFQKAVDDFDVKRVVDVRAIRRSGKAPDAELSGACSFH